MLWFCDGYYKEIYSIFKQKNHCGLEATPQISQLSSEIEQVAKFSFCNCFYIWLD